MDLDGEKVGGDIGLVVAVEISACWHSSIGRAADL